MSFLFGDGGDDAADASVEAAGIQADYQREALDYLREVEALPREYREQALGELSGLFGLGETPYEGISGVPGQAELIEEARQSPLYSAILGGREAGEEAILRHQSATGGLRSGATQGALTDYSTQLENQALLESYNQAYTRNIGDYERDVGDYQRRISGLSGLAGIPSQATNIANLTSGIGQTEAQGLIASAQARESGRQQGINNLVGLGNLGVAAFKVGLFSDIRLKENIEHIGEVNGHHWYAWDWSEGAKELGLEGASQGFMAHEIFWSVPEAIGYRDGFITLDYDLLEVH